MRMTPEKPRKLWRRRSLRQNERPPDENIIWDDESSKWKNMEKFVGHGIREGIEVAKVP